MKLHGKRLISAHDGSVATADERLFCRGLPVKVLLVDDEPGVLRALERLFRRHGHEVCTAPNGQVALELAAERSPDAVVSDFLMDGMTGVELLLRIEQMLPRARRVLLSGFAEVDGPLNATFIRKPYDPAELLRACQ